jgi:hypothetical protein
MFVGGPANGETLSLPCGVDGTPPATFKIRTWPAVNSLMTGSIADSIVTPHEHEYVREANLSDDGPPWIYRLDPSARGHE